MFVEQVLRGVPIFSFTELSQIPHFIFAVSTRQTDSQLTHATGTDDQSKKIFWSGLLDIEPADFFTLHQIHSARTVVLKDSLPAEPTGELGPADGVIVMRPGLFAALRTADCMPVVTVFPEGRQFALFHMGWRGAGARILEKGLKDFLTLSGAEPDQLIVGLGPCIRRCCYEVGTEVRETFEGASFRTEDVFQKGHLDLVAVARIQLLRCGVKKSLDSGLCTACRTDLFYSYRREATKSRMWTLAGFRENPPSPAYS
jgi:YfiH family protein